MAEIIEKQFWTHFISLLDGTRSQFKFKSFCEARSEFDGLSCNMTLFDRSRTDLADRADSIFLLLNKSLFFSTDLDIGLFDVILARFFSSLHYNKTLEISEFPLF